jgi:hypothetical protein
MPVMNSRRTTFQMRPVEGRHYVFLVRANGTEIPRDRQQAVYGPETQARCQIISDALNRDLLAKISRTLRAERGVT